ncbi:MAG TPA: hypothetical protein VFJ85_01060 [Acidimicrobiales bacterium]|nr:hypothetical protein [Acidimicrobiales bacterium]
MAQDKKTLVVNAVVDVDGPDKTMWIAQVVGDASPFSGLFAWGQNFADARASLAQVVWAAVSGGAFPGLAHSGLSADDLAAVQVLATTRKTFTAEQLSEAV